MLIGTALRTHGCSYCGEEETAGRTVDFCSCQHVWIDRSKKNPSLARALTIVQTQRWPAAWCALCVPYNGPSVWALMPQRVNWTCCAILVRGISPPHLFYCPGFYYELLFSFVLLLMSCHLLCISSLVRFVSPTAFTFSKILSNIAFPWLILIFLCCSSTTCLFASPTHTSNSMALHFT